MAIRHRRPKGKQSCAMKFLACLEHQPDALELAYVCMS
jgi:hypothetical protein